MEPSGVMVVGGAGFLGGHVSRRLAGKIPTVVSFDLVSLPGQPGSGKVQSFEGDLLDPDALARCLERFRIDAIVHTVAAGNEEAARKDPVPAITLNVQGTLHALEAARRQGVRKFVYISTGGVYGSRQGGKPIGEDEPITWRGTIYHPSHYMGEILVEMYHQVYGLDTVILRPLALYGPGIGPDRTEHLLRKSLFFGRFVLKALRGEEVEVDNADTTWDLTYVKDAAWAVELALSVERPAHRIYNISSGALVSYRDIAEMIRKFLPQAKFKFHPGVQDNPLRPTRGPLDISLARGELGYVPQYDLERGMEEYIGWVKAEGAELNHS